MLINVFNVLKSWASSSMGVLEEEEEEEEEGGRGY